MLEKEQGYPVERGEGLSDATGNCVLFKDLIK